MDPTPTQALHRWKGMPIQNRCHQLDVAGLPIHLPPVGADASVVPETKALDSLGQAGHASASANAVKCGAASIVPPFVANESGEIKPLADEIENGIATLLRSGVPEDSVCLLPWTNALRASNGDSLSGHRARDRSNRNLRNAVDSCPASRPWPIGKV